MSTNTASVIIPAVETGIEQLRKLVNVAGWTNEWAFDDITDMFATIRLLQACLALDLETLPDQLTPAERKYAAKHGKVRKTCIKRLYQAEYGKAWVKNLTGTDRALYDSL